MTPEEQALVDAVDWFAAEMKKKLLMESRRKRFREWQWQDPIAIRDFIPGSLMCHAQKLIDGDIAQAVDVADLAMFIAYAHRRRV